MHLPGEFKLNIFGKKSDSQDDEYVARYMIKSDKAAGPIPGFPRMSDSFEAWGLELIEPLQNIHVPDGRASVKIRAPEKIRLAGRLMQGKQHLDNGLCFSKKRDGIWTILVHAPEPGEFKLNIFGKKSDSQDDEYVARYMIKSDKAAGPIPGFPRISDSFEAWGLELIEPLQNIHVPDGRASVKIRAPEKIRLAGRLMQGKQHLDNGLCFSKKRDGIWTILVHAPEPGEFKLNIFGKKSDSQDDEYMARYMIKSDKAAGLNPGFPYLKDDFKEWGLGLVDQPENIVSHDGLVTVTISHPNEVSIKSYLFDVNGRQIGYELPAETVEMKTIVMCELPGPGGYKLNIFGTNSLLDSSKKVYLGSYKMLYEAN